MSEKRTLLQKILLGLLAAMTVLFAVLTGVNRSQPLVQWGDSLLRPAEEGNAAVYTSAVYGEDIAIRGGYGGGVHRRQPPSPDRPGDLAGRDHLPGTRRRRAQD